MGNDELGDRDSGGVECSKPAGGKMTSFEPEMWNKLPQILCLRRGYELLWSPHSPHPPYPMHAAYNTYI